MNTASDITQMAKIRAGSKTISRFDEQVRAPARSCGNRRSRPRIRTLTAKEAGGFAASTGAQPTAEAP